MLGPLEEALAGLDGRPELHKLFGRFHRVEGVRGRSFEGSGIGLALTNELVRLHGGSIDVESDEGRGTTFTVRLPFGNAHLAAEKVREAGQLQRRPTGRRPDGFVCSATHVNSPTVSVRIYSQRDPRENDPQIGIPIEVVAAIQCGNSVERIPK
jgi:hypothetical protein